MSLGQPHRLYKNVADLSSFGSNPRVALTFTSYLFSKTSLSMFKPSSPPSACTSSPWHTAIMSIPASRVPYTYFAQYADHCRSVRALRDQFYSDFDVQMMLSCCSRVDVRFFNVEESHFQVLAHAGRTSTHKLARRSCGLLQSVAYWRRGQRRCQRSP